MTASPPTPYSLRPTHAAPSGGRSAFTLIETALAMLAIGLGLLAFLGLSRLGLQSNRETLNDQRCAALSTAIFETLRERNACFVDLARTNNIPEQDWFVIWYDTIRNNEIAFPQIANITSPGTNLVFETITPAYDPDRISLADWNPRYDLFLSGVSTSTLNRAINLLQFTLHIFPDGDTDSSDMRVYTTTLTNPGGL